MGREERGTQAPGRPLPRETQLDLRRLHTDSIRRGRGQPWGWRPRRDSGRLAEARRTLPVSPRGLGSPSSRDA